MSKDSLQGMAGSIANLCTTLCQLLYHARYLALSSGFFLSTHTCINTVGGMDWPQFSTEPSKTLRSAKGIFKFTFFDLVHFTQ